MDFLTSFLTPETWQIIVSVVVTAVVPLIGVLYARVTGKQLEAMHRAALQSALTNGINWALVKLGVTASQAIKQGRAPEVAALATNYINDSVPDAVRNFDLTNVQVEELAVAKLPQIAATETPPAQHTHAVG